MAKKPKKTRKESYDTGFIQGKKAFFLGMFPIFIFIGLMATGAWLLTDYYNKITVNEDSSNSCRLVRKLYPSSIKADQPCDITDKDGYELVQFNQNPGSNGAPVYMSFKVNKSDRSVTPAYDTK